MNAKKFYIPEVNILNNTQNGQKAIDTKILYDMLILTDGVFVFHLLKWNKEPVGLLKRIIWHCQGKNP